MYLRGTWKKDLAGGSDTINNVRAIHNSLAQGNNPEPRGPHHTLPPTEGVQTQGLKPDSVLLPDIQTQTGCLKGLVVIDQHLCLPPGEEVLYDVRLAT